MKIAIVAFILFPVLSRAEEVVFPEPVHLTKQEKAEILALGARLQTIIATTTVAVEE